MKIPTGQEYAAKIINTKKLSARGGYIQSHIYVTCVFVMLVVRSVVCWFCCM